MGRYQAGFGCPEGDNNRRQWEKLAIRSQCPGFYGEVLKATGVALQKNTRELI